LILAKAAADDLRVSRRRKSARPPRWPELDERPGDASDELKATQNARAELKAMLKSIADRRVEIHLAAERRVAAHR